MCNLFFIVGVFIMAVLAILISIWEILYDEIEADELVFNGFHRPSDGSNRDIEMGLEGKVQQVPLPHQKLQQSSRFSCMINSKSQFVYFIIIFFT